MSLLSVSFKSTQHVISTIEGGDHQVAAKQNPQPSSTSEVNPQWNDLWKEVSEWQNREVQKTSTIIPTNPNTSFRTYVRNPQPSSTTELKAEAENKRNGKRTNRSLLVAHRRDDGKVEVNES